MACRYTKMTGCQFVEEAVNGPCTFHPFVHEQKPNVGAIMRKPISNTAVRQAILIVNYTKRYCKVR